MTGKHHGGTRLNTCGSPPPLRCQTPRHQGEIFCCIFISYGLTVFLYHACLHLCIYMAETDMHLTCDIHACVSLLCFRVTLLHGWSLPYILEFDNCSFSFPSYSHPCGSLLGVFDRTEEMEPERRIWAHWGVSHGQKRPGTNCHPETVVFMEQRAEIILLCMLVLTVRCCGQKET